MMYGFDLGLGALWMIPVWLLQVIVVAALIAALANNKASATDES